MKDLLELLQLQKEFETLIEQEIDNLTVKELNVLQEGAKGELIADFIRTGYKGAKNLAKDILPKSVSTKISRVKSAGKAGIENTKQLGRDINRVDPEFKARLGKNVKDAAKFAGAYGGMTVAGGAVGLSAAEGIKLVRSVNSSKGLGGIYSGCAKLFGRDTKDYENCVSRLKNLRSLTNQPRTKANDAIGQVANKVLSTKDLIADKIKELKR